MLNANLKLRNIYDKIQKQIFYMVPEKWDRLYLYASVLEHYGNVQTGEMFFYYYPKGLLKKNPVSVYEVASKFNIDEESYLKLAENLYNSIKELRTYQIEEGEKPWTNLTISIEDFKFNVEFNYENLVNSVYTNQDRHLIWSYKYLKMPLSYMPKENKKKVERYLEEEEFHKRNNTTYCEGIYEKPISNLIKYNKEESYNKVENEEINIEETIDNDDTNTGVAWHTNQEINKDEEAKTNDVEALRLEKIPETSNTTVLTQDADSEKQQHKIKSKKLNKKAHVKEEIEEEQQFTSQILMCK